MRERAGEQLDAPDKVCDGKAAQPLQVIQVLARPHGGQIGRSDTLPAR
jgi:hypothetical protein